MTVLLLANQNLPIKIQFNNKRHPIDQPQKILAAKRRIIVIQNRTQRSAMRTDYDCLITICSQDLFECRYIALLHHSDGFTTLLMIGVILPTLLKHIMGIARCVALLALTQTCVGMYLLAKKSAASAIVS